MPMKGKELFAIPGAVKGAQKRGDTDTLSEWGKKGARTRWWKKWTDDAHKERATEEAEQAHDDQQVDREGDSRPHE